MPVRSTMSDLITLMRDLIDDTDSTVFTDQQIQDQFDIHRIDEFQKRLQQADDVQPSGVIFWRDFYADINYWENGVQLQDHNFHYVTADSLVEPMIGHWQFTQSQIIPIYATGRHYDIYATAVDLLLKWKSKLKLQVDFMDSGRNYQRMQRMKAIDGLVKDYRSRMKPRTIRQVRRYDQHVKRHASGRG